MVLALVAFYFTDKEKVLSILKAGLLIHILFSSLVASLVILFTPQFVNAIGTPASIVLPTILIQSLTLVSQFIDEYVIHHHLIPVGLKLLAGKQLDMIIGKRLQ